MQVRQSRANEGNRSRGRAPRARRCRGTGARRRGRAVQRDVLVPPASPKTADFELVEPTEADLETCRWLRMICSDFDLQVLSGELGASRGVGRRCEPSSLADLSWR